MLKLAGQRLDLYDDADLLRDVVPPEELRTKFAEMVVLDPQELELQDDSVFGAVLFEGPEKVASRRRCWPCHDRENAEISLVYFKQAAAAGWMPNEMRNQVASNIAAHCGVYQIPVDAEVRKWASDHGEWLPGDNFIDLGLQDDIAPPDPEKFAMEKVASGERLGYYPCGTPDEISASMMSLMTCGPEVYGLSDFDGRKVAAVLMSEAEQRGMPVPDEIAALGSMEKRSAEEIHGLLLHRLDRVGEEKLARLGDDIYAACLEIESEEDPIKQAGFIGALDQALGFHEGHYLTGIPEPLDVVFRKSASDDLRPVRIVDEIGRERIEQVCGPEKLAEFEKDAEAALESCAPEIKELLLHGAQ